MGDGGARLLDGFFHDLPRRGDVAQTGGKNPAQGRMLLQLVDQLVVVAAPFELADGALQSPPGTTLVRRRATRRSMMSATAMIEASNKGQIGQPAA